MYAQGQGITVWKRLMGRRRGGESGEYPNTQILTNLKKYNIKKKRCVMGDWFVDGEASDTMKRKRT